MDYLKCIFYPPNGPIYQAIKAIFGQFYSIETSLLVTLCIPLDWNISTCCANHNKLLSTKLIFIRC